MQIGAEGSHPLWDREELDEIYAEWRAVFDEYDPPRIAVAEAWVEPARRHRYAAPTSLGQAFNFDLLRADFDADGFRAIIDHNLESVTITGSSNTWVFSNHDVVRHATRYGLPDDHGNDGQVGREWLLSGGVSPALDPERGLRRARAASLLMLALPGSAYLFQGEELGLPEVADLPDAERQDPTFFRSPGVDVGRDGCRVPLPWARSGSSFGFGADGAHLPQPSWFGEYSVEAEEVGPRLDARPVPPGALAAPRPAGRRAAHVARAPVGLRRGAVVRATGRLALDHELRRRARRAARRRGARDERPPRRRAPPRRGDGLAPRLGARDRRMPRAGGCPRHPSCSRHPLKASARGIRPVDRLGRMADSTFDIVSKVDKMEADNAVNQARKEVEQRYDFKNVGASVEWSGEKVLLKAQTEERVKAVLEVVESKFIKRGITLRSLDEGEPFPSGKEFRIEIGLKNGIDSENAKKISKIIRDEAPKSVKSQIQGDELRVSSKSRDDLQATMALLKGKDLDVALQFTNFR